MERGWVAGWRRAIISEGWIPDSSGMTDKGRNPEAPGLVRVEGAS